MSFSPQYLLSRALKHRRQAAKARRLASTVPQDDIAVRLLALALVMEAEAVRDEEWAQGAQLGGPWILGAEAAQADD
jgi:hypothetical protein